MGLLIVSQLVCPGMEARGTGVVAITGATASLRGKPFTSAFAPAKGAQRMLAQSLARQLNPAVRPVQLDPIKPTLKAPGTN